MDLALKIVAVIALVFVNGFFVAAEFALVKVRDTQLTPLVAKGSRRARAAARIINNLDSSLSACQLGITLASLGLGWFSEPVFEALLQPLFDALSVDSITARESISGTIGFLTITFLHITAGEQAPKWLAIRNPLPATLWVAQPLAWFHRISYPFIWLLNHSSLWMLRSVGLQPVGESGSGHSEDELRLIFTAVQKRSGGSAMGRELVLNALDLRHRVAREVMRPRHEIVAFDTEASIAECLDLAEKTRYSRFPLCEHGDLDKTHGVIHIKDLYAMRLKARKGADLIPAIRKLVYVPELSRLETLLQILLDRKVHVAVVVDEYGGTVGLLTLENVLEELVGQIQDEFDQEKPLLRRSGEQVWEIDGALALHELSSLVGEDFESEGISTASGFITDRLGRFPRVGDNLRLGEYTLSVEELDGMKVSRMRLERRSETGAER